MATPTIDQALRDPKLLGAALGPSQTWAVWLAVLRAAFGLPLDAEQAALFAAVAGGRQPPSQRVRELWAICGRRAGKSRIAAAIAIFLALFAKHRLAKGETGMVLVLAASQDQAKVVFKYCQAFLEASPVLAQEVAEITRNEIRLTNGVVICTAANSFKTVRGRSLLGTVFDECAMWRSEDSSQPDTETYTACLPGLLTTGGVLIGISTGYRRFGLLFQKHRDYFGRDSDDTLVVQGGTVQFNLSLTESDIAAQRAADPAAAVAEWDGGFRSDIASFLDDATLDAAVEYGRPLELPPRPGVSYACFVDAAGGAAGGDAYTLAVAHRQDDHVVLDVVRGVSGGFDPHRVTKTFATFLKQYGVAGVVGDHYSAQWVASAWRDCGLSYTASEMSKSEIYLEALPLFTRGQVRLPDHPQLLRELRLLERRTHRSGKDSVDHGRNLRDDHANAALGALRLVSDNASAYVAGDWVGGGDGDGLNAITAYLLGNGGGRNILW